MELDQELAGDVKLLRHLEAEKREHQRRIKELDDMMAESEARVQLAMGGEETPEEEAVLDGKPVATWKITTQKRLNQKLLREKFPRVHEACKEEKTYRTFKVVLDDE